MKCTPSESQLIFWILILSGTVLMLMAVLEVEAAHFL
jgi:hypothetical protein